MSTAVASAKADIQLGAWPGEAGPIDVQIAARPAPVPEALAGWARAALGTERRALCIRVVDEAESRALNARFRGKAAAANVLAFPADAPGVLGDLAICAGVVAREAGHGGRAWEAHFAHLVVHGVLHLQGMDHKNDAQASQMEAAEVRVLAALGFGDPYAPR